MLIVHFHDGRVMECYFGKQGYRCSYQLIQALFIHYTRQFGPVKKIEVAMGQEDSTQKVGEMRWVSPALRRAGIKLVKSSRAASADSNQAGT